MYTVVFSGRYGNITGVRDVRQIAWSVFWNRPGWFRLSGLEPDWYDRMEDGGGIKILRYGDVVFTGQIARRTEMMTFAEVSGIGDLGLLAWRLALPEINGNFATQAYDVRTGPAESVVLGLVRDNASDSAPIMARRLNFRVAADLGRGKTVTIRCRFHSLLEKAQEAAFAGNIGMRLIDNEFSIYEPSSEPVIVLAMERQNLVDYRLESLASDGNYGYGGGQGEGTERMIVEWLDPASVLRYGRREFFVDRRDTNQDGEIREEILGRIRDMAGGETLQVVARGVAPWRDVRPGDMVRVLLPRGREVVARVQQIRVDYRREEERVTLGLGERLVADGPIGDTVRVIRDLGRRVGRLEVM